MAAPAPPPTQAPSTPLPIVCGPPPDGYGCWRCRKPDSDRPLRVLACGHTFCPTCLKEMKPDGGGGGTLACPVDKFEIPLTSGGVEDLPEAAPARPPPSSITARARDPGADRPAPELKCPECVCEWETEKQKEPQLATLWCATCEDYLCASHSEVIHKLRKFREHRPVSIEGTCSLHPGNSLVLFCEKDKGAICRQCQTAEHKGHPAVPLQGAINTTTDHLKGMLPSLNTHQSALRRGCLAVQKERVAVETLHIDSVAKLHRQFEALGSALLSALETRKGELIAFAEKVYRTEKSLLDNQASQLAKAQQGTVEVLTAMESLVKSSGLDATLLGQYYSAEAVKVGRAAKLSPLEPVLIAKPPVDFPGPDLIALARRYGDPREAQQPPIGSSSVSSPKSPGSKKLSRGASLVVSTTPHTLTPDAVRYLRIKPKISATSGDLWKEWKVYRVRLRDLCGRDLALSGRDNNRLTASGYTMEPHPGFPPSNCLPFDGFRDRDDQYFWLAAPRSKHASWLQYHLTPADVVALATVEIQTAAEHTGHGPRDIILEGSSDGYTFEPLATARASVLTADSPAAAAGRVDRELVKIPVSLL